MIIVLIEQQIVQFHIKLGKTAPETYFSLKDVYDNAFVSPGTV